MSVLLLFLALVLAALLGAAALLLLVVFRKGPAGRNLFLALLLIVLALGVWYTAIRTPPLR